MNRTADLKLGQEAAPPENDDQSGDLKRRTADKVLRWLFGQESIVVILILILAAVVAGIVFLYRDLRDDSRQAYEKEAAARQDYQELDEKNRQHDAAQADAANKTFVESNREFARTVGQSLDRLADEIRRTK